MTARKRSLGQGNIFAPVCHSVHGGGGVSRPTHWGDVKGSGRGWGSPGPHPGVVEGSKGQHPGGMLRGMAGRGLQAYTRGGPGPGGVSQYALRQTTPPPPPADSYC